MIRFGGVDAIADEIRPRFDVDRFFDRAKMEARAQAVRWKARGGRGPSKSCAMASAIVERVLGIGHECDQRTVAGIPDPVVRFAQRRRYCCG